MTHRALWNVEHVSKRLGSDGYKWFLEKAEPRIASCEMCKGSGEVSVPDTLRNEGFRKRDGTVTNYTIQRPCGNCLGYVELLEQFVYSYHYFVPPAYRWCILRQLKPYEGTKEIVPLERQQVILDMLRAEPEGSYMFFGPAHCGKTVWTTALFIQNLWLHYMRYGGHRGRSPIWRMSAKKMLDQHTDYAMRRYEKDSDGLSVVDEPDITAEKIIKLRHSGQTFKLYLEEIDKIAQTDSRRNNLFEIVNTLHEQEGILVLNSNLRPEEFAVQFGEDFAWRIGKKCKTINLFDAK
jgi:hypothetical protein